MVSNHPKKLFRRFDGKTFMGFKGKVSKEKIKKAHKKGLLIRNIKTNNKWIHYIHNKKRKVRR